MAGQNGPSSSREVSSKPALRRFWIATFVGMNVFYCSTRCLDAGYVFFLYRWRASQYRYDGIRHPRNMRDSFIRRSLCIATVRLGTGAEYTTAGRNYFSIAHVVPHGTLALMAMACRDQKFIADVWCFRVILGSHHDAQRTCDPFGPSLSRPDRTGFDQIHQIGIQRSSRCVSGSPKRTLNSITFTPPFSSIIRPA